MTSTTVAQHTTQPLNFGPEWLRALSTPDSATSIPTSGGSSSGNVFKFSATKYRYSKDEILALRANISERLTENTQNEIIENLRDVESVFRPNAMEPLALTAPTPEETVKMNALSSYISGRTPGGAGRTGSNTQQSQQEPRNTRGGGSMSNGRGGSRGRGGRDNTYGSNRGNNNNSDDNGENGNTGDETAGSSSSWSRSNYHPRGGSFGNRIRSFDDRDQSQTFRRGGGGGGGGPGSSTRQTADGWRRSRGDDDDSNEQNEDSPTTANGSSSWASRGGPSKRGGSSSSSMDLRTKSNEKWNSNDDRPGPSNSYESNQQRGGGGSGWRTNASTSDRDFNSRRPPVKRDRMPEWMDDDINDDEDNHLNNATFEQDGTFTRSSAVRQSNNNTNNELERTQSQSGSDETLQQNNAIPTQHEEESKPEKTLPQIDTTTTNNAPIVAESVVSQPTPPVQQSLSTWDDDFDHSDVATAVVESTLAEATDYSPPISARSKSRLISMEQTHPTASIIPQPRAPLIIDDKQWFYKDPQNTVQGPFSSADMERWFTAGYFTILLPVKRLGETQFTTIQQLTKELGRLPFRSDAPSLPSTPVQKQQPVVPEPQKFNPMTYATSSVSNNAFIDDYLMQQQQSRQNAQHSLLFNRQTSMPISSNDRKTISSPSNISSQLQTYFNSQQQQQQPQSSSSIFPSNIATDPAIIYQQQLQRSMSSTNSQQSNPISYDDMQRSFRQLSSHSTSSNNNNSLFFPSNASVSQQQSNDLMTRLTQAMQTRSKQQQQQEKFEEERRRELEMERLKSYEQARLQREEAERRKIQDNRQINFEQLTKTIENKNQSSADFEQILAYQSLQYQKEQAKLEAQQAENVRRYQQHYREQQPQQSMYKIPETANWPRHLSQNNDSTQLLNFTDIQKQEQDRRSHEATAFAHQYGKSEILPIPNSSPSLSSPSTNKPSSWARTLFAGSNNGNSNIPSTSSHILSDHNTNENTGIESSSASITSYNQQATNAVLSLLNIHPKSRSVTNQQSTPWNGTNNISNTSLQDLQRQQAQNEMRQQQQQPHHILSDHSSTSTPVWGSNFQQPPTASQQSPSSSSALLWNNQQSTLSSKSSNKPSTPWTELKPTSPSAIIPAKINPTNDDVIKTEREAKHLYTQTRTQDALSKWTQTQFKDNLKDIDVPTLIQLLKDIDNAGEIIEYVQPYIGSVSKAKEFANDFLSKRNQLANAEPDLDNERLNELVMAPTSSNDNSGSGGDEGFQLASSNGQKKKAKKMKGQKIDVKQLGFMVNNRPEQRDDIDKVPM
ncbi:unnamed protein product [Adineta steineri]|uniref:GYF domain-containing protein n=2 Tax=Adineta steineri TaxID=433720 RepID=A0A818T8G5_9BILA|nr:unnamed protein product [Adineta steineri]